ncbi:methylated-DNA--[protein]-cysteine S-methyltransferase [Collinsella intestinalis]|uniref:methylated-DNA--[protein]-cysteine S-methyltransferase n=1 Tax=Collinsella intestinalis TaxID=147207 RepID=UPI00195A342B|nr:methylated-DNA--[protein]-cysteine S-methyltransferase [Collinsella intestinalis]MBM6683821.1 methylated-DNA--[protein]-cysteine S-methyltransferase [Collinsella intestinalis]
MDVMTSAYASPLGTITLAADERGLAGLWFDGQQHFGELGSAQRRLDTATNADTQDPAAQHTIDATRAWLDAYFADENPGSLPPLHLQGTPYQQRIWHLLLDIEPGTTTTYGALAQAYEERFGARTSPRAVGSAVGRNPVSLIVPCHRVLGADGSLTGYAGGVERKRALLALERASV